jgi:glutamine amidotransferase
LGISCSAKTRPTRYFAAFRRRGKEFADGGGNPDGWGIALYPGGKAAVQLFKEALPAASSRLAKFVFLRYEHMRSKIFVAHVRKASRGIVAYRNTHPFCREVMGRDYAFAHNGTIRNSRRFALGRFQPVGSTDSERLFCYLLNYIEERCISGWTEEDFIDLWKILIGINRKSRDDDNTPNKLNMLLSDGKTLICYTDLYGRGTLHMLTLPAREEVLSDGSAPSACPQGNEMPENPMGIIATEPLDDDPGWVSMEPGELCAMRNGVQVFSTGKGGQD